MGDPRPEGRDAVAMITALLPVYLAKDDAGTELAWTGGLKILADILGEKSRSEQLAIVAHLANTAAALAVRANPEDPYTVIREIAQAHT